MYFLNQALEILIAIMKKFDINELLNRIDILNEGSDKSKGIELTQSTNQPTNLSADRRRTEGLLRKFHF